MSEKQLTVKILSDLTQSIESLGQQVAQQDQFLRDNFRHYNTYSMNVWGLVSELRMSIGKLQQIAASNADNAHLLSSTEEEPQPIQQQQSQSYWAQNVKEFWEPGSRF